VNSDYLITAEPRGDQLKQLFEAAAEVCNRFLVVRTDMPLRAEGTALLTRLRPMLLTEEETDTYPGGILPWGTLTVLTYELTPRVLELATKATDRLFDWLEPDLPNDPCFLRDGDPWMITMASDREAILVLSDGERDRVLNSVRGLRLRRA